MDDSGLQFYEALAGDYHLIFADWREAVLRQGAILDQFIREQLDWEAISVLDCSCGIGTQAIGLALRGYRVHALDLSPAAIARARREAATFGASLSFAVADMRQLEPLVEGRFDVVLSCDNSLAHLLTGEDLLVSARAMRSTLQTDGLLLLSVRDYDPLARKRPRYVSPNVIDGPAGRRIVFQVWDWRDDDRAYTLHHFIVRQTEKGWTTTERVTECRAWRRDELTGVLRDAGFADVRWHAMEETEYVLPIVTARNYEP